MRRADVMRGRGRTWTICRSGRKAETRVNVHVQVNHLNVLQPLCTYQHLTFAPLQSASYTLTYVQTHTHTQCVCAWRPAPPREQGQTSDKGLGSEGRTSSYFKIAVRFLRPTQQCTNQGREPFKENQQHAVQVGR